MVIKLRNLNVSAFVSRIGCMSLAFALMLCCGTGNSQTVATWTGAGDGTSYSDATNWDIGVVPVNGGGSTFAVVIGDGAAVTFDVGGAGNQVAEFELAQTATLTIDFSRELSVADRAVVAGRVVTDNGTFISQAPTNADNSRLNVVTGGGFVQLADTTYANNRGVNETIFSAEGSGSVLDLSSLTSITYGNNGGQRQKIVSASASGSVDLSGVEVIDVVPNENDLLDFRIDSGGTVDLSSLRSINSTNGNGTNRVRFEVGEAQNYSLGALESANFTQFALQTEATLTANSLTALEGGAVELGNMATLNATSLTNVRNTQLTIVPDRTYNIGQLSEIDNARISVSGGVTFDSVTDTSYVNDRNASETIFSSEGSGSILDLSSLTSITYGNGGGQRQKIVSASANGSVDLSGVEVIDVVPGENDLFDFRIDSGGMIDLSSLRSINPTNGNGANRVRFEVGEAQNYSLGALETADFATVCSTNGSDADCEQPDGSRRWR